MNDTTQQPVIEAMRAAFAEAFEAYDHADEMCGAVREDLKVKGVIAPLRNGKPHARLAPFYEARAEAEQRIWAAIFRAVRNAQLVDAFGQMGVVYKAHTAAIEATIPDKPWSRMSMREREVVTDRNAARTLLFQAARDFAAGGQ